MKPLLLTMPFLILTLFPSVPLYSWSEHTLMSHRALYDLPEIKNRDPVTAKTLVSFLVEEEEGIEKLLEAQEQWARDNISNYAPRPDELAFRAGEGTEDIVERFLHAIRLHPEASMRLYVDLLPGETAGARPLIEPGELATLEHYDFMKHATYVELREGEKVSPLMVLCSANNEPDYGFDVGLFENNNTPFGAKYGFGDQPFGNPNLEYSSQAPFHMGFYHEPGIVFLLGPFLKRTYPEYRIHLFKTLSEYALGSGQDYWGWRFMGWGMHYLGDLSMPYHASPLPGVSASGMIRIHMKAMLGFPESRDHAVQLVSNRHTVMERFQGHILRNAYDENDYEHPFMQALSNPVELIPYRNDFPRNVVAKESAGRADFIDRKIEKYMPAKFVSDPEFEVSGTRELSDIVRITKDEKGKESVEKLTLEIAEMFRSYRMHMKSYLHAILDSSHP